MTDNWEDWANEDYEVPVLQTEEQLKRLEERKLVEESDNALANELFQTEEDLALSKHSDTHIHTNNRNLHIKKSKPTKEVNKQKENEEKQKATSKKLKEEKVKREKVKAIFGETEEDNEFTEYEDKFY